MEERPWFGRLLTVVLDRRCAGACRLQHGARRRGRRRTRPPTAPRTRCTAAAAKQLSPRSKKKAPPDRSGGAFSLCASRLSDLVLQIVAGIGVGAVAARDDLGQRIVARAGCRRAATGPARRACSSAESGAISASCMRRWAARSAASRRRPRPAGGSCPRRCRPGSGGRR